MVLLLLKPADKPLSFRAADGFLVAGGKNPANRRCIIFWAAYR